MGSAHRTRWGKHVDKKEEAQIKKGRKNILPLDGRGKGLRKKVEGGGKSRSKKAQGMHWGVVLVNWHGER